MKTEPQWPVGTINSYVVEFDQTYTCPRTQSIGEQDQDLSKMGGKHKHVCPASVK